MSAVAPSPPEPEAVVEADAATRGGEAHESGRSASRWRRAGFGVVHLLLVYHLVALVIAPATIPPSSQLQRNSFLAVGRYLEALSLNHGYHYFAPDPGESRLLEFETNTEERGRLPNRSIRPRLLYHRYFMLSESQPTATDDPQRARLHYASLAAGLRKHTGADSVRITRVTHELATPQFIRAGFLLGDEGQYRREPIGTFHEAGAVDPSEHDALPLPPPETLPAAEPEEQLRSQQKETP